VEQKTEIVALQENMLDEAVEVFLSAYEREAFTAVFFDLSRERTRGMYSRLVKLRYALYLEAGHPIFSAVENGRVTGLLVLESPHIAMPKRSWFTLMLSELPHCWGLVPHAIRGIRLVGAMRRPRSLPKAHYTLEAIAVRPSRQGKGVGRLLLEQAERYCLADKTTSGVYLFTGDKKNRKIYGKFGYQLLETKKAGSITSYHMFRANAK
jgi:GNAT superfamily N-acetyltransferase